MQRARWSPAIAVGLDGKIYVIGGDTSGYTMEVFSANAWKMAATPALPSPKWSMHGQAATTGMDGRIYVVGGETDMNNPMDTVMYSSKVYVYSPTTQQWSSAADLPIARAHLAVVTGPDGLIYAIGGSTREFNGPDPVATVDAYNPRTNKWTSRADMPTFRSQLGAAVGSDGRIYAVGGSDGVAATEAVEAYTPSTDTWTAVDPLPSPINQLAVAADKNGNVYAMHGGSVNVYKPSTNAWRSLAPPPTSRLGLAAVTGTDGRIYCVGGRDYNNQVLKTVELFTP